MPRLREPPSDVTETAFTSQQDAASGGNVSEDEVQQLVTDDLTDYWGQELGKDAPAPEVVAYDRNAPSCSGTSDGGVLDDGATYCASTNTIAYDQGTFDQLYSDVGDFGAGMLIAAAWSSSAQHAQGQPIGTDTARLRADCLTGAWTGSIASGERSGDTKSAASVGRRPRRGDPDFHGGEHHRPRRRTRLRVRQGRGVPDRVHRRPQRLSHRHGLGGPRASESVGPRQAGEPQGRRSSASSVAALDLADALPQPLGERVDALGRHEQLHHPGARERASGRGFDQTLLDQSRLPR